MYNRKKKNRNKISRRTLEAVDIKEETKEIKTNIQKIHEIFSFFRHISPTKIDLHVGKQLQLLRLLRGFTYEQLAEKLSNENVTYTPEQIELFECALSSITIASLLEICLTLRVHPNYFFDGFEALAGIAPQQPSGNKRYQRLFQIFTFLPRTLQQHIIRKVVQVVKMRILGSKKSRK